MISDCLVRLAAAISKHAGVSGRSELHNLDIPPAAAAQVALRGLSQTQALSPSQVRSRITARFPELDRVPQRPQLDTVIAQTGLGLIWSDEHGQYRFDQPYRRSPTERCIPANPQPCPPTPPSAPAVSLSRNRITLRCWRVRSPNTGFLVIGVPIPPARPGEHERLAHALAEVYDGEVTDLTSALIAAMQELASQQGVSWDKVRSADAPDANAYDARGLRAVVSRVMPTLGNRCTRTSSSPRAVISR